MTFVIATVHGSIPSNAFTVDCVSWHAARMTLGAGVCVSSMPLPMHDVERMVKLDEGPRIGMTDVGGIDLFLDVLEFTMNT